MSSVAAGPERLGRWRSVPLEIEHMSRKLAEEDGGLLLKLGRKRSVEETLDRLMKDRLLFRTTNSLIKRTRGSLHVSR